MTKARGDAVIAATYVWGLSELSMAPGESGLAAGFRAVPAQLYAWGALATLAVILGASLAQMLKLREGGQAIAEMIGARRVSPDTRDPLERRLLNVVEEMAIASGARIPAAYVMEGEGGINAFAAGYDVSNAVVAVTRGALETLNRNELQGVIAHEFSHILNGDMWLNIRMLGILAGIVFISAIGGFIMRSVGSGRGRKDSSSGGLFAIGLALFVIGYVGLFFARLIKAAVSRQREFLADASSVQFTRNPDAIAGALDQIQASGRGALVANRYAEDLAHMFFGQGISVWFGGLFDTHPALDERIRRVNPRFQPSGYRGRRIEPAATEAPAAVSGLAGIEVAALGPAGARASDTVHAWGRSAAESAALVGSLESGKADIARRLLGALPPVLLDRLREPEGAGASVLALLLAAEDRVMEEQLAAAGAAGAARLAEAARTLAPEARGLGPAFRLPLIDLALPALKAAPAETHAELLKALEAVILADRRVSLHEFVVLTLVRSQLDERPKRAAPKYRTVAGARGAAVTLLSLLALAGCGRGPGAQSEFEAAFSAGAKEMGLEGAAGSARDALTLEAAGAALEELRGLAPLAKAILIKGLFAAVTGDGKIRLMEAELMRMVGAVLDCPLPPLLEEIDPSGPVGY
ncbi:MAG: M48 family metallopeptidase [Betaproteobacteria bacterium]|nr:M48 family metallopeptidase [Betaproteobacteria bacterium]